MIIMANMYWAPIVDQGSYVPGTCINSFHPQNHLRGGSSLLGGKRASSGHRDTDTFNVHDQRQNSEIASPQNKTDPSVCLTWPTCNNGLHLKIIYFTSKSKFPACHKNSQDPLHSYVTALVGTEHPLPRWTGPPSLLVRGPTLGTETPWWQLLLCCFSNRTVTQ